MSEDSWKEFWERGEAYLRIAERGLEKPEKFNAEALYNIASMAIEGLFMGRFVASGGLPRNHTLADLVEFEQERAGFPAELAERLLSMDAFQSLCSLDAYRRASMSREDLAGFIITARAVREHLSPLLPALSGAGFRP